MTPLNSRSTKWLEMTTEILCEYRTDTMQQDPSELSDTPTVY